MVPFIAKLLSSTLLWCCLLINFTQFVILENLSILVLALTGVKGLKTVISSSAFFTLQSTDHTFVEKLTHNCGKNNVFIKSKNSRSNLFGISHYAGKVREIENLLTGLLGRFEALTKLVYLKRAFDCQIIGPLKTVP